MRTVELSFKIGPLCGGEGPLLGVSRRTGQRGCVYSSRLGHEIGPVCRACGLNLR